MKTISHRFTRQQLYDLVWASPIISVAKTLGLSDVALAKACKKANIPVPPRGYWVRLKAGKHVVRIQLGQRGFGKSDEVYIGDRYAQHRVDLDADIPAPPSYAETPQDVITRAQSEVKRIPFPKTLANPHHLVEAALKEDEVRRAELVKTPYYWKKPIFDTPEAKRKLKILNAIFTVMTRVGEKPYLKSKDQTMEASVLVGEMHISLVIESLTQKKRPSTDGKQPGTKPLLILMIEHHGSTPEYQTSWADTNESPLEGQIEQIAAGLLIAGEMRYRSQAQYSYGWMVERKAEHEKEKRRQQESMERERLEQLLKLEREKRQQLLSDALSWRRANEIRAFVAKANAGNKKENGEASHEKLHRWSVWALSEADQMDPLKRPIEKMIDYLQHDFAVVSTQEI